MAPIFEIHFRMLRLACEAMAMKLTVLFTGRQHDELADVNKYREQSR